MNVPMANPGSLPLLQRAQELFGRPRGDWRAIDEIIYGWPDYFHRPLEEIEAQRFRAVKESLAHHYEKSRFYRHLCREYNFHPDEVREPRDLERVPMIPDTFFKEYPTEKPREIFEWLTRISTAELGDYDYAGKSLQGFLRWAEARLNGLVNHSSGTTGHYSIMFRDRITYQRFYYSGIRALVEAAPDIGEDPHFVYPGSPRTYLTAGRWLGEAATILGKEKCHFLTDREVSMVVTRLLSTGRPRGFRDRILLVALRRAMARGEDRLLEVLEDLDRKKQQAIFIALPFQVYGIILKMKQRGLKFRLGDSGTVLFTGGGWKIFENRKVSAAEFAAAVHETLGIPPERTLDLYGMSEMNGLAISCSAGYKHLTPWIHPFVLDDEQGNLGYGQWGRFAFLDPAANSYPGFILTGDRVRLFETCPACSRTGPVLDPEVTRMAGAEPRGCANLMRGLMAKEFEKAEKKTE